MLGGEGYAAGAPGWMNDLWKFDLSTNLWTWMHGDTTVTHVGVYGVKGVAAPTNRPGARISGVGWTDTLGNLWLYGGQGTAAAGGSSSLGFLNDVWKYNIAANDWTWVGGDSTLNKRSNNGTIGVEAASNDPEDDL